MIQKHKTETTYTIKSKPVCQSRFDNWNPEPIEASLHVVNGKLENISLHHRVIGRSILADIPPEFLRELADAIEELDK